MTQKKEMSKVTMVIILGVMLFTSYFIGIYDGKLQGKEEMCEIQGGWLGMNTQTKEIGCFNFTYSDVLNIPGEINFDSEEIKWE